jgi:tRNA/tmRNA/rRNA uracil-C5-methylase (TrmA/RlmC/RlmD family)
MRAGDEITIEPAELVAGGAALAKVDGFPIFVMNVYPGDVARVRIVEVKKGFARGELVRIESPSPLRRAVPCPIANECGGCDWTALRLDAQLAAKERILRESLRRVGKLSTLPPITLHPSPLNYRIRSRLHVDGQAVGFYAMGSHRVVPLVRECEVVGPLTAAIITRETLAREVDTDASDASDAPHPPSGHPRPSKRGEGCASLAATRWVRGVPSGEHEPADASRPPAQVPR